MRYNITKYWRSSLELMAKKPIVILPFVIIAFFEGLALELIYFAARPPISAVAGPVIRKFFGEAFIHYPGNLIVLPRIFYYAQVAIYVSIGVMMSAITVNIFKNLREGLPVRMNALLKNAGKRYFGYFIYGCLIMVLLFLSSKAETFLFTKIIGKLSHFLPKYALTILSFGSILLLFITSVIIYTLMISTVPLMVLEKKSFLKSCGISVLTGARSFLKIFPLILLPFIVYLPLTILKGIPEQLADKTFPGMNLLVIAFGTIITIFVDCFVILCVSGWLVDNRKT